MNKAISFSLIFLLVGIVALPVYGAIEYGSSSYSVDLDETDIGLDDIGLDDLSASSSVNLLVNIFQKSSSFFKNLDSWLQEKAGIDIIGILKTLATWFVVLVEWMIDVLKLLIERL